MRGARSAHKTRSVVFLPLESRLAQAETSGGVGEHCSSSAVWHGVCATLGRVAQPRLFLSERGNPAGAAIVGAPSFGSFSWQDKKRNLLSGNPRRFCLDPCGTRP